MHYTLEGSYKGQDFSLGLVGENGSSNMTDPEAKVVAQKVIGKMDPEEKNLKIVFIIREAI
jgi:hypothetical protein